MILKLISSTLRAYICFLFVVIINVVEGKKYDIDQHCKDEYGLDLNGVLRQFRRSDDYLQILKRRTDEFDDFFMDVLIQSMSRQIDLMEKQIKEDLGINEVTPSTITFGSPTGTTMTAGKGRKLRYLRSRRQGFRKGDKSEENGAKKLEKVQLLDQYARLNSPLSVEERNHYKNMGFTFAGEIIHDVIRAFDGDPMDNMVHSTRGLSDDKNWSTTTEHMLKHVATNSFEHLNLTASTKLPARLRSNSRFALVSRHAIFGR